jgi:hypothetical protein
MKRAFALALVAACGDDGGQPRDAAGYTELAVLDRDVDILFLVDDSPSTADKQANLATSFPAFVNTLSALPEGLPDVHIGVVTSDVGTRGAADTAPSPQIGSGPGSCKGSGWSGQLHGAMGVSGSFISDIGNWGGGRTTNYAGTLSDAFASLANVGSTGCAIEQPLAALKSALTPSLNPGFLRADAALALVVLTDEDDCSLEHSSLLGTDTATLGNLDSFRCTRFGITCDTGGADTTQMNQVGAKNGCHSNETSAYLTPIARFSAFFSGVQPDPDRIMFAAIAGDPTPFAVELRTPPGGSSAVPALAHSCMYDGAAGVEVADPAVRLAQVANSFRHHRVDTVCQRDLSAPLTAIAQDIGALVEPCIRQDIALPADCQVVDRDRGGGENILPSCSATVTSDCFDITADAARCPDAQHLRVTVNRSMPRQGRITVVRCIQ